MRDRLRLAANVLGVLLLIAAVAPFVVYAVPAAIGADHGLVVLSGSMEPRMSPGDAVIVREVPRSEIQERDIITFQTDSPTPTTHRVIEVRRSDDGVEYVTKGDANEEADRQTVPYSRVIGEVVLVIPFLGHVVQFANTQMGFLALVLTPMVLFVVSELWELATSIRGKTSESEPSASGDADTPESATTAEPIGDSTRTAAGDADDDGSFTLTRSSVQLLLLLFGFYVPYSGYVAYTTREAWSIATATATVIGFLFCLVIYVASRDGGDSTTTASGSAAGVVRRGELPRIGDRTTVPQESVGSLVRMALDRDDWVIYDPDRDTYCLPRDDALYLHRAAPETDGGTAVDAAEGDDGGERS